MFAMILVFLRGAWPYLLAGFVGFNAGWVIQQTRLDRATNDHDAYKLAIGQRAVEEQIRANQLKEDADHDWHKNIDALHAYYRGKPGRVLPVCPPTTAISVPAAASGADERAADDNVGADGVTAEACAVTTLQLLSLQAFVIGVQKGGD